MSQNTFTPSRCKIISLNEHSPKGITSFRIKDERFQLVSSHWTTVRLFKWTNQCGYKPVDTFQVTKAVVNDRNANKSEEQARLLEDAVIVAKQHARACYK